MHLVKLNRNLVITNNLKNIMKKLILIIGLVVLYATSGKAQVTHTINNMTFSLPANAVKIANTSLAPYSEVQQKFVYLPHTYKINEVYLGFTDLKKAKNNRDSLEVYKANQDYDMSHDLKIDGIYNSKIEAINGNDVYFEYMFSDGIGDYERSIGQYFIMVYNYDIKKMFVGTVAFENQSNYDEATKILYDFLNSVSFPAYVNTEQSATFTRIHCSYSGGIGNPLVSKVEAGKFTSRISQADADAQALESVNRNGQFYADTGGTCTYSNTTKSGVFTKTGCIAPRTGSSVTYIVNPGTYTSTDSPFDADAKAQADVDANGQKFANDNGFCVFKSAAVNRSFRKVCTSPKVGTLVPFSAAAGAFTSILSQADADSLAQKAGQDNANLKGTCK